METVINELLKLGYCLNGETDTNTFRIITSKSYPLPGAEITTGGRQRLSYPNSSYRVTVGKRTVCFYEVDNKKAYSFNSFKTSDIELIVKETSRIINEINNKQIYEQV